MLKSFETEWSPVIAALNPIAPVGGLHRRHDRLSAGVARDLELHQGRVPVGRDGRRAVEVAPRAHDLAGRLQLRDQACDEVAVRRLVRPCARPTGRRPRRSPPAPSPRSGKPWAKRFAACADCGVPFTCALEESPCSAVATSARATRIVAPHAASVRFGWAAHACASLSVIPAFIIYFGRSGTYGTVWPMSNPELTPVSYLVLGLVACGASTSYELKQKVASSVGFMWSFPHSALYAEPARLVHVGLLTEEKEEHGRRRRLYALTDEGRAELDRWLLEPPTEPPQLRDLGLLKLFFSNLTSESDVRALAEAQVAAHRSRLAVYEAIEAGMPAEPDDPFPFATLRMGLMCERTFIAFWEEIAANPPRALMRAPSTPAPAPR